jgi:pimeloyl-ACP methyl ester carboxylesterase
LVGLDWLSQLDLRDALSDLTVPLLMVFGGQDKLVAAAMIDDLKVLAPASDISMIKGMAHYPCGFYGAEVQNSILAFVSQL